MLVQNSPGASLPLYRGTAKHLLDKGLGMSETRGLGSEEKLELSTTSAAEVRTGELFELMVSPEIKSSKQRDMVLMAEMKSTWQHVP